MSLFGCAKCSNSVGDFSGFRECREEKELGGPFARYLVFRTGFQFFSTTHFGTCLPEPMTPSSEPGFGHNMKRLSFVVERDHDFDI